MKQKRSNAITDKIPTITAKPTKTVAAL